MPPGEMSVSSNALRRGLWPALRRAGLRRVNMHSLRHSFASALIAAGSPVTEVNHPWYRSSILKTPYNTWSKRDGARGGT